MSRISIVVGLVDNKSTSPVSLVYLGRSGDEMRRVIEQSTAPRHLIIPHAAGFTKNNPRAAANAAAEVPSDPPPAAPDVPAAGAAKAAAKAAAVRKR